MKKILTITKWLLLLLLIAATSLYFFQDIESKALTPETRQMLGGDYLKTDQGTIHYQLEGDENAELVVLVHGFGVASYLWEPTYQFLLKQGYRVLRFDLFGTGFSDRPDVSYTLELYSTQINDLLNGLAITKPIHLIGLSMGGPIVTRFTHQNPHKVHSLILQDPLVNQLDVEKSSPWICLVWASIFLRSI
ncbi:MAG: alpha/beta fold hydrolase [Enterobacterales bacterium]|nr:alpha/beta fold hydrolase [Enterobacterales bacterium]